MIDENSDNDFSDTYTFLHRNQDHSTADEWPNS